jgi:hypothetical protein
MKYHYISSAALLCSLMLGGCGVQNNHPARTQSYQNMGDQGYHIKPNQGGANVSSAGQSTTYSLTRKKVTGNFDLYKSNQVEAKLNRAGITGYRVLADDRMVFLGLSHPDQQTGQGSPNRGSAAGQSTDKGFGTPSVPNVTSSDKGFGNANTPQINDSSNQLNDGTQANQFGSSTGTPGINKQITNNSNQIPVNPSINNSSRVAESSATNVYKSRHIIEKELGSKTAVQFVDDPAGVDAITIIKQKLSSVGTPRPQSIQTEIAALENSINK